MGVQRPKREKEDEKMVVGKIGPSFFPANFIYSAEDLRVDIF